jgi:hypothetical protein
MFGNSKENPRRVKVKKPGGESLPVQIRRRTMEYYMWEVGVSNSRQSFFKFVAKFNHLDSRPLFEASGRSLTEPANSGH